MNKFEAVILFSPDLSNPIVNKEEDKLSKLIQSLKGKIHEKENWGLKDLSNAINNYKKAFYKYYQIEILGSELKSIKKRDKEDRTRKHSRLKKTKDSYLINTTNLSIKSSFLKVKKIMDRKL